MRFFLRLKAWQLFMFFLPYYLLQIMSLVIEFTRGNFYKVNLWRGFNVEQLIFALSFINMLVFVLWSFLVGSFYIQLLGCYNKKSTLIASLLLYMTPILIKIIPEEPNLWFLNLIIVGLLSIIGLLGGVWVSSLLGGLLCNEENQKNTNCIWLRAIQVFFFNPIGIWFIQPHLNTMIAKEKSFTP